MSSAKKIQQKVLIIEDEATQRKILEQHLKKLDYEVLVAINGKDGIEQWEKAEGVRLVLTDLEMPDAGGFEVVKHIRNHETAHTYIMILTTKTDKESLVQGLSLQVDDFVGKPIIKEELDLRLKSAIRLLRLEDHDKLVVTLSELAAIRSGEPDTHLKRVKEYCRILAGDICENHPEAELSKQNVEDIANISVLHDIGKICIPDGLLHKRGRYTSKEYEIIKEHTTSGADILKDLYQETASSFLHIGYEIVLGHHERWDGSGYPKGLQGEEIPLPARIVSFADTYDAILSRRPYKDPLPLSTAATVIIEESGKQFDPMVVEAFKRNQKAFEEVYRKFPQPSGQW